MLYRKTDVKNAWLSASALPVLQQSRGQQMHLLFPWTQPASSSDPRKNKAFLEVEGEFLLWSAAVSAKAVP